METFMKEFQHLKIQLDDIKSATNDFDDNKVIGAGGFGKVYRGEISHFKGRSMVAFKRLDRRFGQGDPEFWKEIMMLSRYTHENLISLLGFCDEGGEKILVYEHASNGSLDCHLSSTSLTWIQRLKICLDAARGLSYLHDDKGTQQRVLHRDIKSSNILLDGYWNAKVSDMGLSKIGPANQQHTFLVTNVVGTIGYLDPMYMELGILTKESDVYSFGVVLFEVLCGRLCFENSNGRFPSLVGMWKQKYKQKKLDDVIFQDLMQEMDPRSLETFSDIAYQCLRKHREERPTMSVVVEKLETTLDFLMKDPLNFKGTLFNGDKTAITALKKGAYLLKYGRRGKPKFCPFRLANDESILIWFSGKEEKQLRLSHVTRIVSGQRTPIFQRYPRPEKEYQSFSLLYNDRSLDLICKDKDEAEVWFSGLKALISRGSQRNWRSESRSDETPSEASPRTYTQRSSPLHSPFGSGNSSQKHQESLVGNGNKYQCFEYKSGMDSGRHVSSSDQESEYGSAEDEEDSRPSLMQKTTNGNGPTESISDRTQENSTPASRNTNNQQFSRKYWRLLQHQNGLRIYEELLEDDFIPKGCGRAMKAVGVVEASCEEIFELVMSMDRKRFEWDCSFQYGSLVEEVDGHTAIVYHRLQLDWFPKFVWPRDLCYVRHWLRNDDGSYDVLFCSREHENCGPQPGYVRAHVESGGFKISPLKPRNGQPRSLVENLMQVDFKGWVVRYFSSFQQHCLLQILKNVAGLREYFAQTIERIPDDEDSDENSQW